MIERLADRDRIRAFLARDRALHLYELGDLDPFFWPSTEWYARSGASGIDALCLVYRHPSLPTLLALAGDAARARLHALLEELAPALPDAFYAHTSPGLAGAISRTHRREDHGRHGKMVLVDRDAPTGVDPEGTVRLGPSEREELLAFYAEAYPGSWFDPHTLETGHTVGIREAGRLVCVAGVHVLSRAERVAALGNVATHPSSRGRGLARRAAGALTRALLAEVDVIGLNVALDNVPAIRCYRSLGFERFAEYDESIFRR